MIQLDKAVLEQNRQIANQPNNNSSLPILQWLDSLLKQVISSDDTNYEIDESRVNPYSGLYIDPVSVSKLLVAEAGTPAFCVDTQILEVRLQKALQADIRWQQLQQSFNLSVFDMGVIAIAIAPDFDLRYEKLYAYLQDDVTRKRPSIDLVLNLLCANAVDKLQRHSHFAPNAPPIRHGLLHLIADGHQTQPAFLSHALKVDEQVSRFLRQQPGLDPQLACHCQLTQPNVSLNGLFLEPTIEQGLQTIAHHLKSTNQPLSLYFQGEPELGQHKIAAAIATELHRPLLSANLAQVLTSKTNISQWLQRLWREAIFQRAVLYLEGLDSLKPQEHSTAYAQLLTILSSQTLFAILSGVQPWEATRDIEIVQVSLTMPDFNRRRACWQFHLNKAQIPHSDHDLDNIADRFRLTTEQISQAIATSRNQALWQAIQQSQTTTPAIANVFAAARTQSGLDLGSVARKIQPKHGWDDLILSSEPLAQLKELCNHAKYHHVVFEQWGFERKLSLGKGLNALFGGSPGTGKTMAAGVIARELQLDLYKIDLSQVVSKYIGETEKNLDRIFTAAENANAILLFDEADALFGKRSEVKDARDRYANLEVAYLLQKMEEYEGITILTTNLRQNLDEAFIRRIRFIISFPFPEEEERLQIWQGMFPTETPLATDVDLSRLAKQFKLAGGSIRNIVLAAAFLAADTGEAMLSEGRCSAIAMKHLLQATKRELQKTGRLINEAEFL
ncbi:AAA family ATPase [Scytonema hofmannii PCC 7110]|uniref:AAA family ATPase n=1 Tax=Scytonema hofmannii PCC 7110 TaxID=128403 RepID=A0A139XG02_9CYAN|nr:AAA family ATPase [Scytonema hofmannii]KYC43625.1 AAA family ATPase [Scytonema hofmannii PCC 7110]